MTKHCFPQLFMVLLLLVSSNASGDPSKRPDSFFQKGYVDSTIQPKSIAESLAPQDGMPHFQKESGDEKAKTDENLPSVDHPDGFVKFETEQDSEHSDSTIAQAEKPDEEEETIPIHSLALLINASEVEETFSLIENMSKILKKFDIQPEAIYTMQIPQFFVRDASYDWANIIIRGGTIEMNRAIVDQYNIKNVPTWIARTAVGDVVLEGYEDISSFLNVKGDLRRRQLERLRQNETEPSIQQDVLPVVIPTSVDPKTAQALKAATTFSREEIQKKLKALQESSSIADILPAPQHKEATHEK